MTQPEPAVMEHWLREARLPHALRERAKHDIHLRTALQHYIAGHVGYEEMLERLVLHYSRLFEAQADALLQTTQSEVPAEVVIVPPPAKVPPTPED